MQFLPGGARWIPGFLDRPRQVRLVEAIREVVAQAPLFVPAMPRSGRAMSVRMTNCGPLGWVTDREGGYRYQEVHPVTGEPWPAMPADILAIWEEISGYAHPPEACLVNFYSPQARMGMHQDRDEEALDAPVVSISLGDTCRFRIGGSERNSGSVSIRLASGDALVLCGEARLAYHGVDRIHPGTSTLLNNGGRINLTIRRVTRPPRDTPASR